jgi:hypothetical protein
MYLERRGISNLSELMKFRACLLLKVSERKAAET